MKLDLHTHCMEATDLDEYPDIKTVKKIVEAVKSRGLDGIAVTEHNSEKYGFRIKKIVEEKLNNQIIIIPGREIVVQEINWAEMVELFLPNGLIFRFLPHPCYPFPGDDGFNYDLKKLHGIEICNALHDRQINKKRVSEISDKYNLVMLKNSDAHSLENIGLFYNEISLEKLCLLSNPA